MLSVGACECVSSVGVHECCLLGRRAEEVGRVSLNVSVGV